MNHRGHRGRLNSLCSLKEFPLKNITEKIISCAIEVHSILGPGLLESVYEEALAHEFKLRGMVFERQKKIELDYKGKKIGKHRIDYPRLRINHREPRERYLKQKIWYFSLCAILVKKTLLQ